MILVTVLSPQYAPLPMTLYFTTPPRLPLTLPYYKMTSEHSKEGRWQMAFDEAKCHQLSMTKERNKTSYTMHDQTLHKVTRAKYLRVETTENLHWGKHIQATAAKTNTVSASAYRTSRDAQQTSRHTATKALFNQC